MGSGGGGGATHPKTLAATLSLSSLSYLSLPILPSLFLFGFLLLSSSSPEATNNKHKPHSSLFFSPPLSHSPFFFPERETKKKPKRTPFPFLASAGRRRPSFIGRRSLASAGLKALTPSLPHSLLSRACRRSTKEARKASSSVALLSRRRPLSFSRQSAATGGEDKGGKMAAATEQIPPAATGRRGGGGPAGDGSLWLVGTDLIRSVLDLGSKKTVICVCVCGYVILKFVVCGLDLGGILFQI